MATNGWHEEVHESPPYELLLRPGPEPARQTLSGFVPTSDGFSRWYEAEMCGLHALNVDNARRVAILCFPSRNARDVVEHMARHAVPLPDGRVAQLIVRSCPGAFSRVFFSSPPALRRRPRGLERAAAPSSRAGRGPAAGCHGENSEGGSTETPSLRRVAARRRLREPLASV